MRKLLTNKVLIIVAVVVIIVAAGYIAYDNYFRLPLDNDPKPVADQSEEKPQFGHFNILILGLDGRQGIGNRTDTIMVATIDGATNQAQLLSIPRDTRVKVKGSWDKINAAYAYGGLELAQETVSDFLDIKLDRYAIIDFKSLVSLVNAVGGLEVDVPIRMYVPLEGIDLEPGLQLLDGEQVLAYVRFRDTKNGDIDRAARQQEVIKILLDKIMQPENLPKIGQFVQIAQENVETDLSAKEMIALGRIAPEVMKKGINSEVLPGKNQKIDGIWYWVPDNDIKDELTDIANRPSKVAVEEPNGNQS